jgi:hypothetical protein
VYFPETGWVPFDVTYNQIGYIDATHIKLKNSNDSSESSTNYEWSSYEADITIRALNFNVQKISDSKATSSVITIEPHYKKKKVAPGSYNLLEVEWTNNGDYYIAEQYYITVPKGIIIEGDSRFNIFLKPHETRKTYHIVKTGTDFDNDYIYTIPSVIPVSPTQNATASYIVSANNERYERNYFENIIGNQISHEIVEQKGISIDCITDKGEYLVNDSGFMYCSITNNALAYMSGIEVCYQECVDIDIGITQKKEVNFELDTSKKGAHSAIVGLVTDDTRINISTEYIVYEIPDLKFIVSQNNITKGISEKFNIQFNLTQQSSSPISDLSVKIKYLDREIKKFPLLEYNGFQSFDLIMDTSTLFMEENLISLTAEYKDLNGVIRTAESVITINFDNMGIIDRILLFLRRFIRI